MGHGQQPETSVRELSFLAQPGSAGDWRLVVLYEAAAETGVWEALPGSPAELAPPLDLDPHAVRVLLDALEVWEFVERDEQGRFHLGRQAPAGDAALALRHHAWAVAGWASRLPQALRGEQPSQPPRRPPRAVWLEALAAYTRPSVSAVVDACLAEAPHASRALDLGGGHGLYAAEFAARGLDAVLQDRADTIDLVRDHQRLADVELFAGDFFEALPPGSFDLVFCAGVAETYDETHNRELYEKLAASLAPGGRLAILAFLRRRTPVDPVFAVQMLGVGNGGDTHGEEEYGRWLRDAGYHTVHVTPVEGCPRALVFAGG